MACISLQFTLSKWCINYKLVGSRFSDRCTYGDGFQLALKRLSYFTTTFVYSNYRFAVGSISLLHLGVCTMQDIYN